MSEPRKSIRLMEREMDRLSALPEPLLHRILEFLGREKVGNASVHLGLKGLKETARTSVLSKQWRFLWTNIPFFFFRNESTDFEEIQGFVASVQAVLAARAASPAPLQRLSVVFHFDKSFASAVDSLIGLAAKNRVKHLSLRLESNRDYEDDGAHPYKYKYALPQMIYSVSSLTSLSMSNCFAPVPETAVEWGRLKWLSIESAELPQEALDAIVKGSPLLGTLSLSDCRGFDRLEIGSRRFRTLMVSSFGHEDVMEISAPYARYCSLTLSTSWWFSSIEGITGKVRVRNAPSLESGSINFCEGLSEPYSISDTDMSSAVEVFQDLRHVKNLHLNNCSTKIVSLMATKGRQVPQLVVQCLTIEASTNYVQSINAVIAMIESCPYLQKLVVVNASSSLPEVVNGDELEEDPITRNNLNRKLNRDSLHLKTVEFVDFFDSANCGEPTLTLARILLKRAPVLKTMAIRKVFTTLETDGVKEALLTYPKASTEVSFSFL